VIVHASIADHTTFESFVAVVRHHFTTCCMDRRGFGASGDADADYSIELDFDDVAARPADPSHSGATPTAPRAPWAAPR
jgi:hypothetical protein